MCPSLKSRRLCTAGGSWCEIEIWITSSLANLPRDLHGRPVAGAGRSLGFLLQLVDALCTRHNPSLDRMHTILTKHWGKLAQILQDCQPMISNELHSLPLLILKLLYKAHGSEICGQPSAGSVSLQATICLRNEMMQNAGFILHC